MTAKTRAEFTAANRAAWNASAHLHEQGEGWEKMLCAASKPGFSVFDPCLTQSLTEVGIAGRRALQIGCNNARELLSLASFGAIPAAGIDQSAQFLDQARHSYLVGDALSLADVQFGHVLFRYYDIDIERADLPYLRAYYDRLCQRRPAYQAHVMVSYDDLRV